MSRTTRPQLSKVLDHHTLAQARQDLAELDQQLGLIPSTTLGSTEQTIAGLLTHATDLGLRTLAEATTSAGLLLAAASGLPAKRHTQFLALEEANRLHNCRNTLLALILAGVASYQGDPAGIIERLPALKMRSAAHLRPHTDDEILLLRIWVLHLSHGNKDNRRAAAVYAQCDAGLLAGETTQVTPDQVTLEPGAGLIAASGHGTGVASRKVPLEPYNIEMLRRYVTGTRISPHARLTYAPRKGEYKYDRAAASASGVIDRVRQAVGLAYRDTTNASVTFWRLEHTLATGGVQAALDISGRSSVENLKSILRHRINPDRKRKENDARKQNRIDL